MLAKENNKGDTNHQLGASQLEIAGLDVPARRVRKTRIRKSKHLSRTEPPLFTNQVIEMTATGAPVISATQAYYKRPEWDEYSPGKFYFQRRFGKGRYIEFYILNKQEQQPESITSKAEQEIRERYGVMAARLHAVFATYATRQNRPWSEPFCLLGSDLIKILRLNRRKDMTKPEKLKGLADLAWIVGTLGAAVHWREGELDLCITRKSPIWLILYIEEHYQPEIPGLDGNSELCEVVIRVQPGAWAEKFLNKEGEQQDKALHQFGYINQAVFDLNPYRQELAAALALYLIQNRRAHSSCKYRIQTLLEAVMPAQEIESIRGVRQYRSRFVQKFYSALETLTEIGFGIRFHNSFPNQLRPDWADMPDEDDGKVDVVATAPKKTPLPNGYFDTWLDGIITITTPPDIEAVLAEIEARKAKKPKQTAISPPRKPHQSKGDVQGNPEQQQTLEQSTQPVVPPVELTGAMVRQARKVIGISQTELASVMGRSQSWVRNIENKLRDKPIPLEYAERLRQTLGIE